VLLFCSKGMTTAESFVLVAHPGHELLIDGWLARARPRVCVLTDGSGRSSASRLEWTRARLSDAGCGAGPVFGRMTDRQAYRLILDGDADTLVAIAEELAEAMDKAQAGMIVTDAPEGFNPVHDLCALIAGAASVMTGARQYEVAIAGAPFPDAEAGGEGIVCILDDDEFARKMRLARDYSPLRDEVVSAIERFGQDVFRRESFRRASDWLARPPHADSPYYESFGEERVRAGVYDHVIRYDQHMLPLTRELAARASCFVCGS
jgi:hypothetical protein